MIKKSKKNLLVLVSLMFFHIGIYAQANTRVTIPRRIITITKALEEIEKQSKMSIGYNATQLEKNRTVDLNLEDVSVEEALAKTLEGSGFTCQIVNNYIMIVAEPKQVPISKKISGTVVNEKNEPLIGVNISNKEKKGIGSSTNLDGKFTIEVQEGDILTVSYIGYKTASFTVTGEKNYYIQLLLDNKLLNEVVVTALGIKREQKALSYNVQQVKGDELTIIKDANFINALQGKVAGVTINASSAGAGGAVRVVMRGTKSLEKNDNALYVIDGIPMFNINSGDNAGGTMNKQPGSNSVADINPEDIESMTILTGPSAAALYGSDASNGVILITTKRGAVGKVQISYSNSTTFSSPIMMPKFQNIYGNREGEMGSWGGLLDSPSRFDPSDFFNTGMTEINGFTLTTGTEKNQTYASISTTNSAGILPNNTYNRYNFSIRNTAKFCNNKMNLDLGAQYIIQNNKNMVGSGQYFNPLVSLYLFPRGENFEEVQMYERYSEARNLMVQYWPESIFGTSLDMQNPYWIMNRMQNKLAKHRYIFNTSLKWDIADWVNITGRIRVDNSNSDTYEKYYASTRGTFTESSPKGFYGHEKQNNRSFYADVMTNVNKTFFVDKLTLNATVGTSINDMQEDAMYLKGGLEQIPNFFHYGNINVKTSKRNETKWHDQIQSVFASAELGWRNLLYLTLTGRNDWASQLAFTSKKSYFYPSVGLSWLINESIKLPKAISFFKVRASWAEVASSPSRYLTQMQYIYNEQMNVYQYPSLHYNTNLKPENTKSGELGINAKFLRNRINWDMTFYRSNTFNQTFYVDASGSSGYNKNLVQTGNIQNQGIELALGYSDTFNKVKVSTNVTYTLNQNKIISLANGAINPETGEVIEMEYYSKGTLGISGGPTLRLYENGTMGDIYINQRLRQSPNGYIWKDPSTGNLAIENTDYRKVGSILPKYHLGWNGSIAWNGWHLGFAFTGRFGGLVVSDTQAMIDKYGVSKSSANARESGGILVGDSKVNAEEYYSKVTTAVGTYYTYNATNIRLSELSLNYQFPKEWFRNNVNMSIGLTGKNLWMIYCKAPYDPESTSSVTSNFYQGIDYFQQPSLRNFGFNVKLTF